MTGLRVRCHAKVNTTLRVVGRRPDGYHDLDLEFLPLALHDVLEIEAADGFHLDVTGGGADVPVVDNLVTRAARALQDEVGRVRLPGARFVLRKGIPAAAGMGGGSSDAAGALLGLCRLLGLELPAGRLAALALHLGSDVPYFLEGGRRRGRGRGELLSALPDVPVSLVVLLRPRAPLSTAAVFRRHRELTDASPGREASILTKGKTPPEGAAGLLADPGNDLWPASASLLPELPTLLRILRDACPGALAGMTGSGPTLHAILPAGAADPSLAVRDAVGETAEVLTTRTITSAELEQSRFEALR